MKGKLSVAIGKVDCVEHAEFCRRERIMAYPTMRWYDEGTAVMPDYKLDRTVAALMEYSRKKIEGQDEIARM